MSDPCWNSDCDGKLHLLGNFVGRETQAVAEIVILEDDAYERFVDRDFFVYVGLWECDTCGQKVLTDSVGIGLGRAEGTIEEIRIENGYDEFIPQV